MNRSNQGAFKTRNLSWRQKEIILAIKEYVEDNGYPPSYRELTNLVGLKSVSTLAGHLDRLKAKGYVSFMPGLPRTLSLNKEINVE
ncbi:hypothetical protein ABB05_07560 [Lederbergia galactosidilytica]|uniref:LexA repressor DNA-binding domain-containing protein n=1 Tax=Lederbergia galactosidilytica TaxID=217031 RepID=A0A177ZYE5_9BACI|nr:hypothetical protein ABB05_07560 [Lederbergia galactosidilytica]